jgi:hypothetical protein
VHYFSPLDEHLTSAYALYCGTNERLEEALDFILHAPARAAVIQSYMSNMLSR